jgi:hypothetical protein
MDETYPEQMARRNLNANQKKEALTLIGHIRHLLKEQTRYPEYTRDSLQVINTIIRHDLDELEAYFTGQHISFTGGE